MTATTARAFSPKEALRFGWEKTTANLKPLLWIGAAGAFLAVLQNALTRPGSPRAPFALLGLCVQVLQVGVTLAYLRTALKLHDGKPIDDLSPKPLLAGFFPFLLTQILVGLIIAGGMVLLIVPGILWGLRFGYAPFVVVDGKNDPIEALRESSRLTVGYRWQLLKFFLLLFVVNLLGAIALGVGLLVTIPTTSIAAAYVFRRLQGRAPAQNTAASTPTPGVSGEPATTH